MKLILLSILLLIIGFVIGKRWAELKMNWEMANMSVWMDEIGPEQCKKCENNYEGSAFCKYCDGENHFAKRH